MRRDAITRADVAAERDGRVVRRFGYNIIRLGDHESNDIQVATGINCWWRTGTSYSRQSLIQRSNNGLNCSVGWDGIYTSGSLTVAENTVLLLCGQTVKVKDSSGYTTISDERLKNSFKDLDIYDDIFMQLKPLAFKYNNGKSGRYHFGFKAQDIKSALENNGFTTKDFAGFVQMTSSENDEDYEGINDPMGLIYTEFTSWNTHMIQKALRKIDEQQKEIESLKNELQIIKEAV